MAGRTITPTSPARGGSVAAGAAPPAGRRKLYFTGYGSPSARRVRAYRSLEQPLALSAFALLLVLYVALPSLKLAGLHVRGLLSVGVLIFLVLARPAVAFNAARKYMAVLLIAGGLALLGLFVSVANGTPAGIIVQSLLEVHLQIVILMLVAAMLAEICGARPCMWALVAIICGSAFFAVLQMLDVNIAWDIRKSLGPLPRDELRPARLDLRPTGLSFSPIQLTTQLCLAFAAFAAVRHAQRARTVGTRSADPAAMLALLVLVGGSVAAATRSPILGAAIFLPVYVLFCRQAWLAAATLFGAALIYLAWPFLLGFIESEAPRMLRTDDKSASARLAFAYYGFRLFIDNPLGYGFGFIPYELWSPYWPDLYMMRGAGSTQENMLHNYVLSMVNIYGVGLLIFAPLAIKLLVRSFPYCIFFVPYAVHILFHNSGPYYSDTIIWFVIAAIGAAAGRQEMKGSHLPPSRLKRASIVRET